MTSFALALILNDTSFSAVSGTPRPMGNTSAVEMVSADIRIKVPSCEVTVVYKFRNTGKKESVTMGFPEEGQDAYLDSKQKTWFKSFKSWVDGKPTPVLVQKVDDPSVESDLGYKVWWVKKVDFEPGQTRTVKNEYASNYGTDANPRRFFQYIVHTARTWKGPIGQLRIEVDTSGFVRGTHFGLPKKPHKVTGTKFAWFYTEIEPTEADDIAVYWQHPEFEYGDSPDWVTFLGPFNFVAGG
ncbi:MAG: DUF4424 family protein [Armatimonadetes bacterium]|nr:DUF4424 family protein [Armatimonadota bacterium]MBX3109529.1 DUF4424 family protein [Fimbriimonadaceae bacterium]